MTHIQTVIAYAKRFAKVARQDGWTKDGSELEEAIRGAEAELSELTQPAEHCDHNSTIVLHYFEDHHLSLELCTWGCGQLLWSKEDGIRSRQISAHEAAWMFAEARKVTR